MSWQVEIEDAGLDWQDVSNGQIKSISAGNTSESQAIPAVSVQFAADIDLPSGLLDPETNRERARLRITDGDQVRYFRIEAQPGSVQKSLDYPTITGRAYAGIITEWPPVTFDFTQDIPAADMARRICTRNVSSQTGTAIGVLWLAENNPTIPGGRFQASRQDRWSLLKEIVEMCGARIRVSTDGKNFEVYDMPDKTLSAAATRTFEEAQSLNYEMLRVKNPANAIRVRGEQPDYTRPILPVVQCACIPGSIEADETSTATVIAKVFDNTGNPVRHKAIIDEAITAGSYTSIPVTDCYSVQAVWLNTGTAESPTKGASVQWSTFTASAITVPDNSTQLFIVSYTQAQSVDFSLSDYSDQIIGEAQTTTGALAVSTDNAIGRVIGVYRATDVNRSGTNYATGGSYTANTTSIVLGITPGPAGTAVVIDYDTYNGAPLSATQPSPSSALCNAQGIAEATIGAGDTVGTAKITASALGVEGYAFLSLTGDAVDRLTLASDKSQILVGSSVAGETSVEENGLTVHSETVAAGETSKQGYVEVSNPVARGIGVTLASYNIQIVYWKNVGTSYRIYFQLIDDGEYFVIDSTQVNVAYATTAEVENAAGSAELTANVYQADGTAASDGTQVNFNLVSRIGGSLSSAVAYTSGGVATTTLTAGSNTGSIVVQAVAGSQSASIEIEVVNIVTNEEGTSSEGSDSSAVDDLLADIPFIETRVLAGGSSWDSASDAVPQDSNATSGSICGKRQLVCKGDPQPKVEVSICGGQKTETDENGWFSFCCGTVGTNSAYVGGEKIEWTIAPSGPTRGSSWYDPSRLDE